MKKVALLIGEKFSLLGTAGVIEMLNETNRVLVSQGAFDKPPIELSYVGLSGDHSAGNYGSVFGPCVSIQEAGDFDLILVPPVKAPLADNLSTVSNFIPWIKANAVRPGTEICSFCTGSFLLAEAGLLADKTATTHWFHGEEFKRRYPEVKLNLKEIIIDIQGIYMSGGATAFMNMTLYLIEKYYGKDVSIIMSKLFLIDRNKESQAPFTLFTASKNHQDEYVLQAQSLIEDEFASISVEHLSDKLGLSARSINRRFKKILGISPIEYIKRVKLEVAKRALEQTESNISEVMFASGYSDQKTFNFTFKSYTHLTPSEYRKRYQLKIA